MSFKQFLDYFPYFCQYLSNYQLHCDIFGSKRDIFILFKHVIQILVFELSYSITQI